MLPSRPSSGECYRASVDTVAGSEWPGFVTVVIPVRNGVGTIEAQLAGLSEQDYDGEWDLIVSDNGSTDGTQALVEQWHDRIPGLRVLDASDMAGASHARNAGIEIAKGRFIALCDADDVVAPNWLRDLVAQSGPGVVVAGSFDESSLNDPLVISWVHWSGQPADGGTYPHLGFLPFARSANAGVDKDVWSALGGFDEAMPMGEDVAFSWQAQIDGHEFRPAPDAVVSYRFRTDIRSVMKQAWKVGKSDTDLYAAFRSQGISAPSLSRVARSYVGLAVRAPQALVSPTWRGRWCRGVAYRSGRLYASIRGRVWYP